VSKPASESPVGLEDHVHPPAVNLADYFVERNVIEGQGARVALIAGELRCSYADLLSLINRAGNALLELGVQRGDRVLLALNDSLEFVAIWFAVQKIAAVTAEVYTFLQPDDYAYYLDYTAAHVVVVDAVTLPRIRDALARSQARPVLLITDAPGGMLRSGEVHFGPLAERQPSLLPAAPSAQDDAAIWKFTTGSTGRPKACVHPARSALMSYEAYARGVLDLRADDVVLPVPKLFFGYARDLTALFPFGVGGTGIVFAERTTPELVFELIRRHRPSILVNVPTMMQAMLDHPEGARQDLGSLRLCTSAGEALPQPLHQRWLETFGVPVLDGIGSSEAYHIYISNRPGRVRPGSLGECVPGYSAQVVDDTGSPLPDRQIGRLWVRGQSVARMYWEDEERSRQTFDADLVRTGDLMERDTDGYFWYRGRADDLLKVAGVWVAPAEIERCLGSHPDVVECAVVGAVRQGLTRACAFVVLRDGSRVPPDDLRRFARERLSPHKAPRDVRVVERLPRTGSGKVDRRALRRIADEQGGSRA
jgi:benzoate-CoA ligase family protein